MKRFTIAVILCTMLFLSLAVYFVQYQITCAYQLGYETGVDSGYVAGVGDTKEEISKRIFDYLGEGDIGVEWNAYCIDSVPLPNEWVTVVEE